MSLNPVEEAQEFEPMVIPSEEHLESLMQSSNLSFGMPSALWTQRREASLNWLALGLLLAAWNAVEDPGAQGPISQGPISRPESLRGYAYVSVRAAARNAGHRAVNKL